MAEGPSANYHAKQLFLLNLNYNNTMWSQRQSQKLVIVLKNAIKLSQVTLAPFVFFGMCKSYDRMNCRKPPKNCAPIIEVLFLRR